MVSFKLSIAMAATGLLQLASARECTARMSDITSPPGGWGSAQGTQELQVWFNDNPDEVLDERKSGPAHDKHLNIYDGVQTLTSDALGGDVRLWATKEDKPSQGLTRAIGSCSGEYMDQKDIEGTVNSHGKSCDVVFTC